MYKPLYFIYSIGNLFWIIANHMQKYNNLERIYLQKLINVVNLRVILIKLRLKG
ncbi:hypothetical protein BACPEC_01030 [[Bacteroides] pectinophilus ATCC 43243]|uniref:Uncharacterized protein n=1 Tax=[Bacteroides] pectinophilus ATCC 43243 TaxID=483218 RepID=B7AQS2_9FIRM|nr:hypothetical protein BACPEC_01030 [[Bacteroides] pectinophilus ATCC 43243]